MVPEQIPAIKYSMRVIPPLRSTDIQHKRVVLLHFDDDGTLLPAPAFEYNM